jgi:hypothetical protein
LVFNTEKSGIQLLSFHCHALCFTWRMWVLWGFAGKKMSGTSIFQKESSFKRYVRGFNLFIRGVQKNRLTEKTEKTDEKLTEKTEPRWKTD